MDTKALPKVSPNNPCPFLRALVAQGMLSDRTATISDATAAIQAVAATGDGSPEIPSLAVRLIALLANGLGPGAILDNALNGLKLNKLRKGPFDKQGAGSRILDAKGHVDATELDRLKQFASPKIRQDDRKELGLDADELQAMMDANYERAGDNRRLIDRQLMNGEWPILLQVMGKDGKAGRYLSVREVNTLFVKRKLPGRMTRKLGRKGGAGNGGN